MLKLTRCKKFFYLLAGGLLAVFGIVWLGIHLLISDMCRNQFISQSFSPDKELKAILFKRDCGATTAYSYQVSVLNRWDSVSNADTGNVFVSYGTSTLKWKDDRTLLITRKSAERIFKDQKEITVWPLFKNIQIEYAEQ